MTKQVLAQLICPLPQTIHITLDDELVEEEAVRESESIVLELSYRSRKGLLRSRTLFTTQLLDTLLSVIFYSVGLDI